MIKAKVGYINPQLESGPYASSYFKGIQKELGFQYNDLTPPAGQYGILNYLYNLSIDTANSSSLAPVGSGELANIGMLIGYPWPSVYAANFNYNVFQFINSPDFPGTNVNIGFGDAVLGISHGRFASTEPGQAGIYIPVFAYRIILKFVAAVKWNGLNIVSLNNLLADFVVALGYNVSGAYTINFGDGGPTVSQKTDIYVNFNMTTANIGGGWLYVLQDVFNRICTSPQVYLSIS
jgi:hypothetical protein